MCSVAEHLSSMREALGSILSWKERNGGKRRGGEEQNILDFIVVSFGNGGGGPMSNVCVWRDGGKEPR